MRIRYEDADKWDDPWFDGLSWAAKLLYDYLHCRCDTAGFCDSEWDADFISKRLKIAPAEAEKALEELCKPNADGQARVYRQGAKIYLHDHITIQDPAGLTIRKANHIATIKRIIAMSFIFPEALKHLPARAGRMIREAKERQGKMGDSGKNVVTALQGLIDTLERHGGDEFRVPDDIRPTLIQKELGVTDVPPAIQEALVVLKSVPHYPFNYPVDFSLLMDMAQDYGLKDFVLKVKKLKTFWRGKPIAPKSNPRMRIHNWFQKDREFAERDAAKALEETRKAVARDEERRRKGRIEFDRQLADQKKVAEEQAWMQKHYREEDVPEVMERFDCDKALALYFINIERKKQSLVPLPGAAKSLTEATAGLR